MKKIVLIAHLACGGLPSLAFGQDLVAGYEAAERGEHETALMIWRPLAEQGNAEAQFQLGLLYRIGTGPLEQSNQDALHWFRLSASQGYGAAQSYLGTMHFFGQGIPQDYETAHMWANIAASTEWSSVFVPQEKLDELRAGEPRLRDSIEALMTPEGIAQAQRRARMCVTSGYKNCD